MSLIYHYETTFKVIIDRELPGFTLPSLYKHKKPYWGEMSKKQVLIERDPIMARYSKCQEIQWHSHVIYYPC